MYVMCGGHKSNEKSERNNTVASLKSLKDYPTILAGPLLWQAGSCALTFAFSNVVKGVMLL